MSKIIIQQSTMKTYLDWSAYHESGMGDAYADIPKQGGDFAKAVAVCINSRQCETTGKGVMCPSYRVSGEPALSTGGRVRMLKQALNSDKPGEAFKDKALSRAMALCVSCKGCKRECENEVDMAQLKIEYLAQRHTDHGSSWRSHLFAHLPRWLHQMPSLKYLITLRNRSRLLARFGQWLLGIHAYRRLPETAPTPFKFQLDSHWMPEPISEVVLFVDTFTHHYEPQIAHSAINVLERAGYHVHLLQPDGQHERQTRPLCCGRTFLAHGLLHEAREEAERTLSALQPYAEAGYPIIGLEPACLLALRDDYRSLGLGEIAERVSSQAVLFEEFIAREIKSKRWSLEITDVSDDSAPLLVHGHCHQKAVGAMKSMRKVLKQIPGLKFELMDSSCCGGGGSFYLETEHADIADDMLKLSLLPRLQASPGSEVVANGFSCRRQIRDNSEHLPVHLAIMLDKLSRRATSSKE